MSPIPESAVPAGELPGDPGRVTAPATKNTDPLGTPSPSPDPEPVASRGRIAGWARLLPGAGLIAVLTAVATLLGRLVPVIGAPVIALVLGVALTPLLDNRGRRAQETARSGSSRFRAGFGLASGLGLKLAVVLLGAQLSLRQVADAGIGSLPVMLGTLAVCLSLAWLLGRWLGVGSDLRTLIGVGTGICGASAIAAVTPVIKARGSDVAYAITTIFACNMLAVLLFPPLGHLLGLSQHGFGVFAGTAVNDTSSVVAAATTYGTVAAHDAVVVKLTRTLMIVPICIGLAALVRRRERRTSEHEQAHGKPVWRLVPWFLPAFLAVVALNSVGGIPHALGGGLEKAAVFLITAALGAIGASVDLPGLRRAGSRPLLLGVLLWIAVAATSLGLQAI